MPASMYKEIPVSLLSFGILQRIWIAIFQDNTERNPLEELSESHEMGDDDLSDNEEFSSPVPEPQKPEKVPTSPEPTKKAPPVQEVKISNLVHKYF